MKLHKQARAVYKTQYHIVWVTRFHRAILNPGVQVYLKLKLAEARQYCPDWFYGEIGMAKDHSHLHMVIPPKYSVSFVIETPKKNTSRRLRERFPFLDEVYWDKGGIWSKGYFVSAVGANEAVIKRYVAMQWSVKHPFLRNTFRQRFCSRYPIPPEPQVKSSEHQDNSYIHSQPFPEPVSEEQ